MASPKAVWRDYDQKALDGQYNLRARWPEHATFLAAWQREGDAERAKPGGHLDLP